MEVIYEREPYSAGKYYIRNTDSDDVPFWHQLPFGHCPGLINGKYDQDTVRDYLYGAAHGIRGTGVSFLDLLQVLEGVQVQYAFNDKGSDQIYAHTLCNRICGYGNLCIIPIETWLSKE